MYIILLHHGQRRCDIPAFLRPQSIVNSLQQKSVSCHFKTRETQALAPSLFYQQQYIVLSYKLSLDRDSGIARRTSNISQQARQSGRKKWQTHIQSDHEDDIEMAQSLYTQSSAAGGSGDGKEWLLQQPLVDDNAMQDVDMLDLSSEEQDAKDDLASQLQAVPATVLCYSCGQSSNDMETVLRHLHTTHGMAVSVHCCCGMCRFSRVTPPPESPVFGGQAGTATNNFVTQAIAPATPPTTSATPKQPTSEADIWSQISEADLPPLLGRLEAGELLASRDGSIVYRFHTSAPPPLLDTNGNHLRSPATKRFMRDIPFLPSNIPTAIPIWHLHFFERLAASQGVDLLLTDIMDRLPPSKEDKKNALDMKIQRYRASMGYLPLVNKDLGRKLAFMTNVETIENLMVWQGKANTVWLPTHIGRKGPWKVVQPDWCEGYKDRVAYGSRGKGSYIISSLPGLSDRVRNIADTIVYLDCKLIDLFLTPATELDEQSLELKKEIMSWCETLEPGSRTRAEMLKRTSNTEFEYWLGLFETGTTMREIRRALEVAEGRGGVDGEEYGRIVGGDEELVAMLSRSWDAGQ